jgi:hypothetical protein
MAFTATIHDRHLDEMRFRGIEGQQLSSTYAPHRPTSENPNHPATADVRAGLTRRFTTDAMAPPQITSVWDQARISRLQAADTLDLAPMDAGVCFNFSQIILMIKYTNNRVGASESSYGMF